MGFSSPFFDVKGLLPIHMVKHCKLGGAYVLGRSAPTGDWMLAAFSLSQKHSAGQPSKTIQHPFGAICRGEQEGQTDQARIYHNS